MVQQYLPNSRKPNIKIYYGPNVAVLWLNVQCRAILGDPGAVEIFVEEDKKSVTLRPCTPQTENSLRVSHGYVSAAGFLSALNLKKSEIARFEIAPTEVKVYFKELTNGPVIR